MSVGGPRQDEVGPLGVRAPGLSFAIEGRSLAGRRIVPSRIVVEDGRIATGGSPRIVWRLSEDEILIPAFHDHHAHLAGTFRPMRGPDLSLVVRREDAMAQVDRWIKAHPGDEPVISEGFDESVWDVARLPTRLELDRLAPKRPVILRRVCGHLAVANRALFETSALGDKDADPETGILTESIAMSCTERWPVSEEEYIEGILRGQELAARLGVVGIDEMGRMETYRAYRHLEEAGRLWLRVHHFFPLLEDPPSLDRKEEARADRRLKVVGLKGFLDGSIGARTAAVDHPYATREPSGELLWDMASLSRRVGEGTRAGLSIALHAIGRRAMEQAITVLEAVESRGRSVALRVEHAEQTDESLFERGREAGVVWSMQPNFTSRWQQPGGLYKSALGDARRVTLNRFRSAGRAGTLLFGSDMMPFGPLAGIVGALGHPDRGECLDVPEALEAYSGDGFSIQECRDPLLPGRSADLVVLRMGSGPLSEAIQAEQAGIVWTAVAGMPVWCGEDATAPDALRSAGS